MYISATHLNQELSPRKRYKQQVPVYARKVRLVVGGDSCPCHRYHNHDSCESFDFFLCFEARGNQENGVKLSLKNKGIYIVQVLMTARLGEK